MRSDKWKSRQPPGSLAVPSHSCTEGKAAPPTHSASRLAHGIAPSRWPVRRYGVDAERRFVHLVLARKQISNGTSHSAPRLDAGPLDWSLWFRAACPEARGLAPGTCGVLKAQPRHIRISTGHDTSGSQIRGQPAVLADGTAHIMYVGMQSNCPTVYCAAAQGGRQTYSTSSR